MNPTMDCNVTPLHLAAKYGHLEVCQFICKNLDSWNNLLHWNHRFIGIHRSDAITAKDLAFMRGHIRTASFIIQYNMVDTYWYTVFKASFVFAVFILFFPLIFPRNFFQGEDFPPSLFLITTYYAPPALLLIVAILMFNFNEIFIWTDPISGNEFENLCKWMKSFDQEVKIMASNPANVEMIEFD